MKRTLLLLALLFPAFVPACAAAEQAKCTLDVGACLELFARTRQRPWLGVQFETDSTGVPLVRGVLPDSPAEKAGLRAGDRIRSIGGQTPQDWFAGKAGWETSGSMAFTIQRGAKQEDLRCEVRPMSDEMFARIIGVHMVEGHLAHADSGGPPATPR